MEAWLVFHFSGACNLRLFVDRDAVDWHDSHSSTGKLISLTFLNAGYDLLMVRTIWQTEAALWVVFFDW